MRSIWKGSLGFGMVAIPVKLYGATENKSIGLNQLHSECGSRIKMPRHCPVCDEQRVQDINRHLQYDKDELVVNNLTEESNRVAIMNIAESLSMGMESGQIIKGYPLGKQDGVDKYIPLTPDDLESLPLQSTKNIVVEAFMKGDITDPRWFNSVYFLAPEDVGVKAFVLFMKAMEAAGVVGIAKISLRERERMCLVRPFDGILAISTLNWGDELRPYDELRAFASVSDKEMEMAQALINGMTKEVDLTDYQDSYRAAMVELITAKLEGKTIEAPTIQKQEVDLSDALLASLNNLEPADPKTT